MRYSRFVVTSSPSRLVYTDAYRCISISCVRKDSYELLQCMIPTTPMRSQQRQGNIRNGDNLETIKSAVGTARSQTMQLAVFRSPQPGLTIESAMGAAATTTPPQFPQVDSSGAPPIQPKPLETTSLSHYKARKAYHKQYPLSRSKILLLVVAHHRYLILMRVFAALSLLLAIECNSQQEHRLLLPVAKKA